MVVGWKSQFTNVLLAAVNPGTWSFSCIALLEKQLTIHRKLSELIALVNSLKSVKLSVVVGEGSVNIISAVAVVETIVGLPVVAEAVMPGVIRRIGKSFYYLVVGRYLPTLLHCPHPNKLLTTDLKSKLYCDSALSGKESCGDLTLPWWFHQIK